MEWRGKSQRRLPHQNFILLLVMGLEKRKKANKRICAQSSRRPEIQADGFETGQAVCVTMIDL